MARHIVRSVLSGIALLGCFAAVPAGANPPCPLHAYACEHMNDTQPPRTTPNRRSQAPAYQPPQPNNYMVHKNAAAAAAAAADRDAILNGRPQSEVCDDLRADFAQAVAETNGPNPDAIKAAFLAAQCPGGEPQPHPAGTIGVRG